MGGCLALLALLCLTGCADRPSADVLKSAGLAPPPGARTITVYAATTRQRAQTDDQVFTDSQSDQLNFAVFTVSVPPNHQPGQVEWPGTTPDPTSSFVTISHRPLDRAAFLRDMAKAQTGSRRADTLVFVHGFNNTLQEALFQLVQMKADTRAEDAAILFAWPSQGSVTGYIADKDAATASRDGLADLLNTLARLPGRGEITLVGHSMGGWLTAEALRQLRLTRQDATIARLKVVLAAPDIDVEVFRTQMATIGPLSPPLTLLVSKDDKALAFSGFLAKDRNRVGAIDVTDPVVQEASTKANVLVVDISTLQSNDSFNHNRYAGLAALYPRLAAQEGGGQRGGLRRAGVFALDAASATLTSPFTLLGAALNR